MQPLAPAFSAPRLPRALVVAIGASVGVHLLALAWQHRIPAADAPPPPLNVVLRPAAPIPETRPAPQPAPAPAPVALASPRPATPPPVRVKPAEAPRPAPVLTRKAVDAPAIHAEAPRAAPPVAAVAAPVAAPPAPAPVPVQADPAPPRAPAVTVARAEPTADETPDPALLERYGRSLSSLLARQQNYPRLAAMRGWEGEVQLRVTIARKGNIVATQIVRSSGFEVLDQNAVQLVAAAAPLPRPPDSLQNREIQVIVPVHYKLEKPT